MGIVLTARNRKPTYNGVVLGVLIYEFSSDSREESNAKITKRLKRKKLGAFNAVRVATLRRLKDTLQKEILKQHKSRYYIGPRKAEERMKRYAEMEDFDIPRLTRDMIRRYPKVPKKDIKWFVPLSVFVNHLL